MYYNDNVTKQVNQLQSLLGKERMARVQQRLKEKGMRTGFTCLFYGGPGTGKTDLAKTYAFSGGQIENIARKQLIDSILCESDTLNINAIHEACKSEILGKRKTQRIGF